MQSDPNYVGRLAKEAASAIEWRRRATYDANGNRVEGDPDRYATFRDGSPQWMSDLAYAAHRGDGSGYSMLPDDYRYEMMAAALDHLAAAADGGESGWTDDEYDEDRRDMAIQFADAHDGRDWLASHSSRASYFDEGRLSFGTDGDFHTDVANGMAVEAEEVYGAVLDFLREKADGDMIAAWSDKVADIGVCPQCGSERERHGDRIVCADCDGPDDDSLASRRDARMREFLGLVENEWYRETKGEIDLTEDPDRDLVAVVLAMRAQVVDVLENSASGQLRHGEEVGPADITPDDIAERIAEALNLLWYGR